MGQAFYGKELRIDEELQIADIEISDFEFPIRGWSGFEELRIADFKLRIESGCSRGEEWVIGFEGRRWEELRIVEELRIADFKLRIGKTACDRILLIGNWKSEIGNRL